MAAVIDENTQFIDELTSKPINNGYIYIGTVGLDAKLNPITIYSDRGLTTPITNPQRTDSAGRSVNKIWVPDRYSIKVEDEDNLQKLNDLQAGELSQVGNTILSNVSGVNDIIASASPAITELSNGQTYILTTSAANTGPMTLKIDTTTVKSIKKDHDQDMASGDLEANQILSVVYNSTDDVFEVISNLVLNFTDVISLAGTAPYLKWTESDATANNGKWRIIADGEQFKIQAGNDIEDTWTDALTVDRTGTVIDTFTIGGAVSAPSLVLTGSPLPIASGGTASSTSAAARTALGAYSATCLVNRSANLSVSGSTETTIGWDQEDHDDLAFHDTVTNNSRITIPVVAANPITKVRVRAYINFDTNAVAGVAYTAAIYKNGVRTYTGYSNETNGVDFGSAISLNVVTPPLTVTDGDYFEVVVWHSDGAAKTLYGGTGSISISAGRSWFAIETIPTYS